MSEADAFSAQAEENAIANGAARGYRIRSSHNAKCAADWTGPEKEMR